MSDSKNWISAFFIDTWNNTKRRIVLGIGTTLLVGGWTTTQYISNLWVFELQTEEYWSWEADYRFVYICSIVCMAIGAGLIAFALPKIKDEK